MYIYSASGGVVVVVVVVWWWCGSVVVVVGLMTHAPGLRNSDCCHGRCCYDLRMLWQFCCSTASVDPSPASPAMPPKGKAVGKKKAKGNAMLLMDGRSSQELAEHRETFKDNI